MMIYIGNLNYHENDFLYYPKTIDKCYFSEYNTKKGLANVQLHNKVEESNTLNYIVSDFIRIVLRKGYSFTAFEPSSLLRNEMPETPWN